MPYIFCQGRSHSTHILMQAHTFHFCRYTIESKSLFGYIFQSSDTKTRRIIVYDLTLFLYKALHIVAFGSIRTPQSRIFDTNRIKQRQLITTDLPIALTSTDFTASAVPNDRN